MGFEGERVHQYGKIPPQRSLVLFRRNASIYKCGVILEWVFNPALGESLWGFDENNETWSLVYFLNDVRDISVPASKVNELIGRKTNGQLASLTAVTSPEKSENVLNYVRSRLQRSNETGR